MFICRGNNLFFLPAFLMILWPDLEIRTAPRVRRSPDSYDWFRVMHVPLLMSETRMTHCGFQLSLVPLPVVEITGMFITVRIQVSATFVYE